MKMTRKPFQTIVITGIVAWLLLFVFLPNLMIIGTSFLTRNDANLVDMVFTLDNYRRLFDPMYAQVMLHSFNMAVIATVCCLLIGYPFCGVYCKDAAEVPATDVIPADSSVLDKLAYPHLRAENIPQHARLYE